MPQCILLDSGKLLTALVYFVGHRQINAPVYFVRQRQINAPVYLLDTGNLMPQCISVLDTVRQINAPVYQFC